MTSEVRGYPPFLTTAVIFGIGDHFADEAGIMLLANLS